LGQYTLKSQEIRKQRGIMMENGKYVREWYDGSSRDFPVENSFPKNTTYQGTMSTTKVKQGKKHNLQPHIMKSREI
jgi:hypothetical protein